MKVKFKKLTELLANILHRSQHADSKCDRLLKETTHLQELVTTQGKLTRELIQQLPVQAAQASADETWKTRMAGQWYAECADCRHQFDYPVDHVCVEGKSKKGI